MKKSKSKFQGYFSLLIIILVTFLITFPAGFVTRAALDPWYYNLAKPALNPPNWIFGPVWTILYAMMSVAVWLAYKKSKNSNKILAVYFIHLLINASWSYVFFYYKQIFLASFIISIIIFFILYLMVLYSKYSKPSVRSEEHTSELQSH